MESTDQQLIDIADKLLAQLQKQYLDIQQHNIKENILCPEDHQEGHQDYQLLDGDQDDNSNHSQDEPQLQGEVENDEFVKNEGNVASQVDQCPQSKEIQLKDTVKQSIQSTQFGDLGQLVEVFPTEQWIPQQKQININSQKIKEFTLKMNLPIPDWVNNDDMLKLRINELFGNKKMK